MIYRSLQKEDFNRGFLNALNCLSDIGIISEQMFEKRFYDICNSPDYHIIVAELDGQIIGSATLFIEMKFIHSCGSVGHIEDVVTRKGFEKRGIASELIKHLLFIAKEKKCYKVILDCREELGSFYKKFGFRFNECQMRLDL